MGRFVKKVNNKYKEENLLAAKNILFFLKKNYKVEDYQQGLNNMIESFVRHKKIFTLPETQEPKNSQQEKEEKNINIENNTNVENKGNIEDNSNIKDGIVDDGIDFLNNNEKFKPINDTPSYVITDREEINTDIDEATKAKLDLGEKSQNNGIPIYDEAKVEEILKNGNEIKEELSFEKSEELSPEEKEEVKNFKLENDLKAIDDFYIKDSTLPKYVGNFEQDYTNIKTFLEEHLALIDEKVNVTSIEKGEKLIKINDTEYKEYENVTRKLESNYNFKDRTYKKSDSGNIVQDEKISYLNDGVSLYKKLRPYKSPAERFIDINVATTNTISRENELYRYSEYMRRYKSLDTPKIYQISKSFNRWRERKKLERMKNHLLSRGVNEKILNDIANGIPFNPDELQENVKKSSEDKIYEFRNKVRNAKDEYLKYAREYPVAKYIGSPEANKLIEEVYKTYKEFQNYYNTPRNYEKEFAKQDKARESEALFDCLTSLSESITIKNEDSRKKIIKLFTKKSTLEDLKDFLIGETEHFKEMYDQNYKKSKKLYNDKQEDKTKADFEKGFNEYLDSKNLKKRFALEMDENKKAIEKAKNGYNLGAIKIVEPDFTIKNEKEEKNQVDVDEIKNLASELESEFEKANIVSNKYAPVNKLDVVDDAYDFDYEDYEEKDADLDKSEIGL